MKKTDEMIGKIVMIGTARNGVYAGRLVEFNRKERTAVLVDARCCVLWSDVVGDPVGLCGVGPDAGCRIAKKNPLQTELWDVIARAEVTDAAWAKWEQEPWSKR